jgi:hypothetical protein
MPKKTHGERVRSFNRFLERLDDRSPVMTALGVSELPVFYNEQDQSGKPCGELSRGECWDLKRSGEGKFINRGAAFQLNRRGPAPPQPRFTPSLRSPSDASISLTEMRANVGEPSDTPGAEIPRHVMTRARQKINAIGRHEPETFDTKAPLAFGAQSWPLYRSHLRNTYEPRVDA